MKHTINKAVFESTDRVSFILMMLLVVTLVALLYLGVSSDSYAALTTKAIRDNTTGGDCSSCFSSMAL